MDHATAKEIVRLLASAGDQLAQALELRRDQSSPEEFKAYAACTGELLTRVTFELLRPVCREYPDLDPDRRMHRGD